ncbi:SDR family oxidoreductase [Vibrio viridaestus]|uniref:SDR family oxidoreductase n=1 Tax=Vibrio viridaestus TaxID=2487322 RepID=A0A3N9TE45_9VIBR|nr:SDR family oxidoreductase [Vibrio viridaestus]RQW62481.1 SDR family oxidoreductase [Vibrio viridaestus]
MSKYILITGCSSGIGLCAALTLKERGYKVIASCRKQKDVDKLISLGIDCIQIDLADSQSIKQGVEDALQRSNNQLYAVFNNGAYGQTGALEDLPIEALKAQFTTNFFGWHELTTKLIPHFRRQGQGRIIQNSSILGFAAMKYRGAYNSSKFALEGWTDTMRLELMGSGIHISLIEPGPIETQFRPNALKEFQRWIDVENSVHKSQYEQQLARLSKDKSSNKFTLPPESCMEPLIHALESPKPKIRYRVTTPTKVFAVLKRILPTRVIDKILFKAA